MLSVALALEPLFLHVLLLKAFLEVIAVNINRVGMLSSTVKRTVTIERTTPCQCLRSLPVTTGLRFYVGLKFSPFFA